MEMPGPGKEQCCCLLGREGARQEGDWGTPESLLPQRAPPGSPAGGHPPADGRVHLFPGAGEDSATAAEHPAQAVHPGSACLRAPGMGREGMGQSWLAGEGTLSLFLGVGARPSALISWEVEMFHTLLAGQGSPVQPGIPYLAGGEGLGSHFPFGVSRYGPVAAPALRWGPVELFWVSRCEEWVYTRLGGWGPGGWARTGCRSPSVPRRRPHVLPTSPGRPFSAGSCVGGWLRGWRHPDVVQMEGRASELVPVP